MAMIVGVNVTGNSINTGGQALLNDIAAVGIKNVRLFIQESAIENPVGTFTWTAFDNAVQYCENAGLFYICPLTAYNAGGGYFDPTYTQLPTAAAHKSWGGMVIGRYGSNPHFLGVEMGNEEYSLCTIPSVSACRNGANYAAITQVAYPYLKALAPSKLVGSFGQTNWIFGSNATWLSDFMNEYLTAIGPSGGPYFDYWNFHFYPNDNPPTLNLNNGNLSSAIDTINTNSANGGYPNTPIYFTEFGWHRTTMNKPGNLNVRYTDAAGWGNAVSEGMDANWMISALNTGKTKGLFGMNYWFHSEDYTSYDQSGRQFEQQLYWWLGQQRGLI